jgi:hypothetical protein
MYCIGLVNARPRVPIYVVMIISLLMHNPRCSFHRSAEVPLDDQIAMNIAQLVAYKM